MLIYNQAFDYNHCFFRLLKLLDALPNDSYDTDKIKILDFYFLFPQLIAEIKLPSNMISARKYSEKCRNVYENIKDGQKLFFKINEYQTFAIKLMVSYELLDLNSYKKNIVLRTKKMFPVTLNSDLKINVDDSKLVSILVELSKIDLYGESGLKDRTGLLEYKYDPK